MDKFERTMVAVLFVALLGWMALSRKMAPPPLPEDALPGAPVPLAATNAAVRAAVTNLPAVVAPPVAAAVADDEPGQVEAETTVVLRNDKLEVEVSSWGGGFKRVALTAYPATGAHDEEPLTYEFADRPAMSMTGIRGLGARHDYRVEQHGERQATVRRGTVDGLEFERRITLGDGYDVAIVDTLRNPGEAPVAVTNVTIALGEIPAVVSREQARGYAYLGVDTLSPEGKVVVWGKKLNALFGVRGGCSRPDLRGVPPTVALPVGQPCVWVAAKNKFFTQIMAPEAGAEGCVIRAARSMAATNQFVLGAVSADVALANRVLRPGGEFTRSYAYYVGPKKFSQLRALGQKQDAVMFKTWIGFGWWRWACMGLLGLLNGIYAIIPNYGVAIILLTILVKVVFWPVTHKGNLHMKKMQSIQPELAKLREKHKGNPKKMQQAQMELYRKHGVNPLAGCLPMVVQIPVFIALFTVLRSAVELRFAGFLWISDLSEPEMLFANVLPIPLNILPIAMTATMALQQKLTPSAGDPQQQKMMMFMPIMMLFFFYSMASGLVLYWTVSQTLAIIQLVVQKRKTA
jgi:YidC/Oxa1 family membrane protein insertase